ncbi:MAG: relaxase [Pseudomonadota bacterium]
MRAIPLPHTRLKLQDLARELFVEHDWQMPRGFVRHEEADPRNYSLAEWQQAKRAKVDPQRLKALFQECWAISDSRAGFAQALKERGYILARGDRRGVVAVDHTGEVYAVARWVGIKTKQVRARIGDGAALPDVETATAHAAGRINDRLKELRREQAERALDEKMRLAEQTARLRAQQEGARHRLVDRQGTRQTQEVEEREARHRRGWRGLIDWVTGRRRRIEAENRVLAEQASIRDKIERRALRDHQAEARRDLLDRANRAKAERTASLRELDEDIRELERRYEHVRGSANSCDNIVCSEPADLQHRRRRKRDGPCLH